MALLEKLQEKLPEFRLQALLLAGVAALVIALLFVGPGFLTLVSFFRPLLLSTALFLAAVLVLRLISPPPAGDPSERTGEELMDYVAGGGAVEDLREAEGAESDAGEAQQGADSAAAAPTEQEAKKSQ